MRLFLGRAGTSRRGFTLLELLICVAIVATLVAIAMPSYTHLLQTVKQKAALADIREIQREIRLFQDDHGRLPDTLAEAGITLTDPWGNPYQYIPIQNRPLTGAGKVSPRMDKFLLPINSDYDLWSMGADGKTKLPLTAEDSHDDIIRAGDGSYYGLAEGF